MMYLTGHEEHTRRHPSRERRATRTSSRVAGSSVLDRSDHDTPGREAGDHDAIWSILEPTIHGGKPTRCRADSRASRRSTIGSPAVTEVFVADEGGDTCRYLTSCAPISRVAARMSPTADMRSRGAPLAGDSLAAMCATFAGDWFRARGFRAMRSSTSS